VGYDWRKTILWSIKKLSVVAWTGLVLGTGCSLQQTQAVDVSAAEPQTVGWVEKAQIAGVEQEVKAKLDTGATTTSINAEILDQPDEETESGGMIRFRFTNGEGVEETFELPIVRWVRIESRRGPDLRRPVVRMKLCVAGQWIEEEVNLANRDDFNYPVLIGRNMLKKGKLVVDSSQTFTVKSTCPTEGA
jgi:hypothetical protein